MPSVLIFVGLLALSVAPALGDELDDYAASLDKGNGMWINGLMQTIDLPADAPSEKVVERIARDFRGHDQVNGDQFCGYHIVEVKKVEVRTAGSPDGHVLAALIESARGSKSIILFYYDDLSRLKNVPQPPRDPRLPPLRPYWWHHTFFLTTAP